MKRFSLQLLFSAATLLSAVETFAQDKERTSKTERALEIALRSQPRSDANGDGVLTGSELQAYRKAYTRIPPTHPDISYGDHERQVFDLWVAESKDGKPTPLAIFIHGGGFRGGNKSKARNLPVGVYLEAGVSFASLSYRLTDVGPFPLQHHDCGRAIQYIRHHAKKWNIDPARIASSGGSAGAGISLWLAFHDDLADPKSDDPIARESTRLTAVATTNGQSTYDLHEFRKIFEFPGLKMHEALYPFYNVKKDADFDTDRVKKLMADASAITHFDKDDRVPAFLTYDSRGPGRITEKTHPSAWVHHIKLGQFLKKRMDEAGIECHVIGGTQKGGGIYRSARVFNPKTDRWESRLTSFYIRDSFVHRLCWQTYSESRLP